MERWNSGSRAGYRRKEYQGGAMSKHKKVERMKELDRKRRRREKSLKLRTKEEKAAAKRK